MERLRRADLPKLEGDVGERWRAIRQSNHAEVRRLLDAGHSVNSAAMALGFGRTFVYACMDDMGIPRPDVSEGNRRAAAMLDPEARKARATAAHEAIRANGRNPRTQRDHAVRYQHSLRYVGNGEIDVAEQLRARGLECVPQFALEGYNVDVMAGHLAVEVHNYSTKPHHTTQRFRRIVEIICTGRSIIYIQTGPDWGEITPAAIDEVVAFHDLTGRNPTRIGQYRVVRGNGYVCTASQRQFNELAAVMARHCALDARG